MWPTATNEPTVCLKYSCVKHIWCILDCTTYWEKAKFLLKIFHLLYKHTRLLVCGCVPGTSLRAPPRATGKDTIGKLSTQWARKFTLVNRETLEDLVILGETRKVTFDRHNRNWKLSRKNWHWIFKVNVYVLWRTAQFLKIGKLDKQWI